MRFIQIAYSTIEGVANCGWGYLREVTFGIFPWDCFSLVGLLLFFGFNLLGSRFGYTHEYLAHRIPHFKGNDKSWRSAFRTLWPAQTWNLSVLKQDLILSLTILLMFAFFIFFLIPVSADGISRKIFPYAANIFGFNPTSLTPISHGPWIDLGYSLFLLIMMELGHWIFHYISHTVPFFWEFHKVHHAQASMTPASDYRLHPIDYTLLFFSQGLFVGIGAAIFYLVFGVNSIGQDSQFVAYSFLVIVYLPASLHHSYRWWSWGKLEWVFLSPAWHILHHSKDPKHFNTNFGLRLTIFDHLFGTVSKTSAAPPPGGIEIGIPDEGYNWAEASLWRLLIDPVKRSFKITTAPVLNQEKNRR